MDNSDNISRAHIPNYKGKKRNTFMIHKAIAQTMIWSMQNLPLAELTINFSNTTGMSTDFQLTQMNTTNTLHKE